MAAAAAPAAGPARRALAGGGVGVGGGFGNWAGLRCPGGRVAGPKPRRAREEASARVRARPVPSLPRGMAPCPTRTDGNARPFHPECCCAFSPALPVDSGSVLGALQGVISFKATLVRVSDSPSPERLVYPRRAVLLAEGFEAALAALRSNWETGIYYV